MNMSRITYLAPIAVLGLCGCQTPGTDGIDAVPDGDPGPCATHNCIDASDFDASTDPEGGVTEDGSPDAETSDSSETEASSDAESDDSNDAALDLDGAVDADTDSAPWPPVCGDGWRDPAGEECDDGLGASSSDRACTQGCAVLDRLVADDAGARERRSSTRSRSLAAGPLGHAVAFIELPELGSGTGPRLGIATFGPVGQRLGTAYFEDALLDAEPALVALPDGDFALAFAAWSLEADGDATDIALARVSRDGSSVGPVQRANKLAELGQRSPDLVWSGTVLTVGWVGDDAVSGSGVAGRRICMRRFSDGLVPSDDQDSCETVAGEDVSHLTLTEMGQAVVTAWRQDDPEAGIGIKTPGWETLVPYTSPPEVGEGPVVVGLDIDTMLLVFTEGIGQQTAVVLGATGETVWGPTVLNEAIAPRFQPSGVDTIDGVYLSWQERADLLSPLDDDVYVQKLIWTGTNLLMEPAITLPHDPAHQASDQSAPRLTASPLAPFGALLASWNDHTSSNYVGEAAHGDVAISLIPTPIVRGGQ